MPALNAPFLSMDQRLNYLQDRQYTPLATLCPRDQERLARINFHYFLGYARNLRALIGEDRVSSQDPVHDALDIVDLDFEMRALLFPFFGTWEWQLRATLVQHHVGLYGEGVNLFDQSRYFPPNEGMPGLSIKLTRDVERSKEPFLMDYLDAHRPLPELPIWTIVDSLSLTTLCRLIQETRPTVAGENLRNSIANAMEMKSDMFSSALHSLCLVRNQIAHHSRLWMKPIQRGTKIPNWYRKGPGKRDISCTPKSLHYACYSLAYMCPQRGTKLLTRIDTVLAAHPLYTIGFSDPIQLSPHELKGAVHSKTST